MAKVYIANNHIHDFKPAAKYGELVDVTKDKAPIFKTDVMKHILEEALADFKKDDYILLTGPTLLCVMITTILARKFDTIKYLVFDAKLQEYVVRHIN